MGGVLTWFPFEPSRTNGLPGTLVLGHLHFAPSAAKEQLQNGHTGYTR